MRPRNHGPRSFETPRTQVGYSRLAHSVVPISGKPEIGARLLRMRIEAGARYRPCSLNGAGYAGFPFSFLREEWSAGRRQGFARPLQAALAIGRPRAPNTEAGLRDLPRGARAACGRFARPAARALRLPALHRGAIVGRRTLFRHRNVTRDDALCEQGGASILKNRNKVKSDTRPYTSTFSAAMNASCGMSTLPNWRMCFLPSFCVLRWS